MEIVVYVESNRFSCKSMGFHVHPHTPEFPCTLKNFRVHPSTLEFPGKAWAWQ